MLNLTPHHRIRIPNGLAVLAAIVLLISSIAGYNNGSDVYSSGSATATSVKAASDDNDKMDSNVVHKRRGLNLSFLLFRRG